MQVCDVHWYTTEAAHGIHYKGFAKSFGCLTDALFAPHRDSF